MLTRRTFLQQTAFLGAVAPWSSGCISSLKSPGRSGAGSALERLDPTIAELQSGLAKGEFTAVALVEKYRQRIAAWDQSGPQLRSVIELNPEAIRIAAALDDERKLRGARGPLHGIPVLIKDNIATHDRMMTTAGSLALQGSIAARDAFLVERLRAAGAVVLGKTNLSEWANFRGSASSSGWSGRGGQTKNPYVLDRNPSGSSSGSAVAVSANLCAVAVGTETDGSIVSPASHCGIVGLKPTVGLISRTGIIPISASQDTAGPMARCVADAAILLGVLAGSDGRDSSTSAADNRRAEDYSRFLRADGLSGARIGVARSAFKIHRLADPIFEAALQSLRQAGAELVDPVTLPPFHEVGSAEYLVLLYEFKVGLNAYFASLGKDAPVKSLSELIQFNEKQSVQELSRFGQETLVKAEATQGLNEPAYREARARCDRWREEFGAVFVREKLDALVAPTSGPAGTRDALYGDHGSGGSSSYAAVAGFPDLTVPCGLVRGLPVGLSFMGPAWQEGRLITLAYAFEQATRARAVPQFLPHLED